MGVTFHSLTMRNILQFSLVFLCFLSHLTEALFFGPIAVGLGLGILAFKKGFLIGTALSSSRTRRSYQPSNYRYTQNHHYDSNYNRWYSKPRRHYYYSSSPYYGRRGKRDTELYNRCDLSSADMVRMIKTEMDNLDRMKLDLENEEVDVGSIEREEVEATEVEFRKLQVNGDDAVNWIWT